MSGCRVLVSAPYLLPVLDRFLPIFGERGIELIVPEVRERLSEAELLPLVPEIDGAICGDDRFTERVLRAAPRLKVISKWGTGIDAIDVVAADRLGIRVCNTPGAFTDPVADTALGYILCFARRLPRMDREMRRGRWEKQSAMSLRESVLGVVGVGDIGQAVVRRAIAFGMEVLGNDIVTISDRFRQQTGLRQVELEELLQGADFVTLNCSLTPSSYHLIGAPELQRMKPSAYLINTARGAVIDEPALVRALEQGRIAGAALDVFEVEPLPGDSPLRRMDNCLLAPHNANSSRAAWERVHWCTIDNLLAGLER